MVNPIVIIAMLPILFQGSSFNILVSKESDTKYCMDIVTQSPTPQPTGQPTMPVVNITSNQNLRALNTLPEEGGEE